MAINKLEDLAQKIKREDIKPVYLLHGAEPYFLDLISDKIQEIAIPEFEKGFNEFILYGKDINVGDLINYARRFPMMAEKQLILVKEAHQIQDIGVKESLALIESYNNNPLSSTILVLYFGKAQDERKTWVKSFAKKGEIVNSKKLYDNEVPEFIHNHCKSKNLKVSPKAIQLLFEHIGNNLQALAKEIEKIKVNLKEGEEINADVIEKFVGISKDYNVFELQKAITDRDSYKCYQIAEYFGSNPKDHPIQPVIIILYNFFSKLLLYHGSKDKSDKNLGVVLGVNPYFLKDYKKGGLAFNPNQLIKIIKTLRVLDEKSKGINSGNSNEKEQYKELIYNILS